MSPNARDFLQANKRSPVVFGSAIGNGGQGAFYRLRSGRAFTLSREECEAVGEIRWVVTAGRAALEQG